MYKVIALAVNAGKKIYRYGDVVTADAFGALRTEELIKKGFIAPVEKAKEIDQAKAKAEKDAAKKAAEKAEKEAQKAAEKAAKAAKEAETAGKASEEPPAPPVGVKIDENSLNA